MPRASSRRWFYVTTAFLTLWCENHLLPVTAGVPVFKISPPGVFPGWFPLKVKVGSCGLGRVFRTFSTNLPGQRVICSERALLPRPLSHLVLGVCGASSEGSPRATWE